MKYLTGILLTCMLAMSVTASTELTDPMIIGNIGFYAYQEGEFALAEKLFLKALSEDPTYEHARFNLATLYHEQQRFDEAIAQLEYLVLQENTVQYQYDLGVNLIANFRFGTGQLEDFYAGIAAYEAAEELDHEFAHVQENLRVLYTIREELS